MNNELSYSECPWIRSIVYLIADFLGYNVPALIIEFVDC